MEVVPDNHVVGKLVSMLDLFRDDPGRTDFAEVWRNFSYMQVRELGLFDGGGLRVGTLQSPYKHAFCNALRKPDL